MEQQQWQPEGRHPLPPQRQQQRSPRLQCPRCESHNTKFCYYNNYSTAQPRHFCRTCKRFWTQGGALRNIPEGGRHKKVKTNNSSGTMSLISGKAPAVRPLGNQVRVPVFAGAVEINAYPVYYYGRAGNSFALGDHVGDLRQTGTDANNLIAHPQSLMLDLTLMQPLINVNLQLGPQLPEPQLTLHSNLMNNCSVHGQGHHHPAGFTLQQESDPPVDVSRFNIAPAKTGASPSSASTPTAVSANAEAVNLDRCISKPSVSRSPPSSSSAFM